jgi:RNA polymerase sigma factor (sigma-70 family)
MRRIGTRGDAAHPSLADSTGRSGLRVVQAGRTRRQGRPRRDSGPSFEPSGRGRDYADVTARPIHAVANELLVLRSQGGDERALAVLYEYWSPRFARHAGRLTGRRDAVPDICQDAWLAIARGLAGLDDPARFPAWAYRIVSRRCADWIRRQVGAESKTTPLVADPVAPDAHAPGAPGGDEIDLLRRAMRRLPATHQVVLALFYGDALGVREIARALEIPPGTVKSRLHHGRQALALILERSER